MRLALFVTIFLALLSGCTGNEAPDSTTEGKQIDLKSIDACSFFDVATIKKITGEKEGFIDRGRSDASSSTCFWGVSRPGFPAYVELSLSRYRGDIAAGAGSGCTVSTVKADAADSAGVTCAPDPQRKISLHVGDQGIKVIILVNEPKRPLTPSDLVPFAESVVRTLR